MKNKSYLISVMQSDELGLQLQLECELTDRQLVRMIESITTIATAIKD